MMCVKCGEEVPVLIGNTQFCAGCFRGAMEFQKSYTKSCALDFTKWMLVDRDPATLNHQEELIQYIASWLTCFYFAVVKTAPLAYPVLVLMRTVSEMANILEYIVKHPDKMDEFGEGKALYSEASKFAKSARDNPSITFRDQNEGEQYFRLYGMLSGITHPKYLSNLAHKEKTDDLIPIINITFMRCQGALDNLLDIFSSEQESR